MQEIIAFNEAFSGLGLMVGPVLGAGFFYIAGYQGMFYLLTAVFLLGAWLVFALISVDKPYVITDEADNKVTALLIKKEILVNCLPLVFAMAAVGFCDTVIAPHLAQYGLTPPQIGILWALSDSGYALFSCFLANALDMFNLKKVNLAGLALVSFSYWLLGPWDLLFPSSPLFTMVGLTLVAATLALLYISSLPNLISVSTDQLALIKDDILIDSLSGIASSATSLGEVLGPLVAGVAVDVVGVSEAGGVLGCAGFACCGVYYLLGMRGTRGKKSLIQPEVELSDPNSSK